MDVHAMAHLANPMKAHAGYDQDYCVVAMIAGGIGSQGTSPPIKKRPEFIK